MKKIFTLVAVVAALAMFTIGASAFTLSVDGNVATVAVDSDGDLNGILVLELSDGLSLARGPQSPEAFVVYNEENGQLGFMGTGLVAGDEVLRLTFEGDGTFTLAGLEGDFTAFTTASRDIGTVAPPPPPAGGDDPTPPPVVTGDDDDDNPKAGVALAVVPAIVAAAAVAITRKRK